MADSSAITTGAGEDQGGPNQPDVDNSGGMDLDVGDQETVRISKADAALLNSLRQKALREKEGRDKLRERRLDSPAVTAVVDDFLWSRLPPGEVRLTNNGGAAPTPDAETLEAHKRRKENLVTSWKSLMKDVTSDIEGAEVMNDLFLHSANAGAQWIQFQAQQKGKKQAHVQFNNMAANSTPSSITPPQPQQNANNAGQGSVQPGKTKREDEPAGEVRLSKRHRNNDTDPNDPMNKLFTEFDDEMWKGEFVGANATVRPEMLDPQLVYRSRHR